jgi:iron complex transport system substrate-binding protein
MRLVSLACSNTEIVAALGLADQLVAVDDHSDFPEEVVSRLPRLGPDLEIDVRKVKALNPDLVLATLTVPGHERVVEELERAGLPFLAPRPTSLADVYRDIRAIAERTGVPQRAEELIARMREKMESPPGTEAEAADRPTILVQWWPNPVIAPGRGSWAHDVIEASGGRNALGHEEVNSRPLTDEEVAELAPDGIVISWCGIHPDQYRPDVVLGNPAWKDLPAIRDGHVFCIPEAYLGRPGPRLVHGVRELRKIVTTLARSRH